SVVCDCIKIIVEFLLPNFELCFQELQWAIEKALHQVTCAHLSCGSLPAAPRTAVAPAGMQLLTASIRTGRRWRWWQGNFSQSGQILIIALFHCSIFYPVMNFILLKLITSSFQ
uniref:Uncharacterized protein n=1 Tax=Bubo bubo TaxID=30461 RepID=A0A8C0ICM2_BUBBB